MSDDEDSVQSAAGSDTRTGDAGMFCVIGAAATAAYGRTWKRSQEDAAAHAKKLIRWSIRDGKKDSMKLFVVQVVEVLETPRSPVLSRKPSEDDLEDMLPHQRTFNKASPWL